MATFRNSFDLAWFGLNAISSPNNVYLDSPVDRVLVWAPSNNYLWWNLTFHYANPIGQIICIQVALRPNDQLVAPVPYGSFTARSSPGLTTVQFRGATTLYSTTQARLVFSANIGLGYTMRHIIYSMHSHIPGYRLRSGNVGSQGWAFLVLHSLTGDEYVPADTDAQFDARAQVLHNSSPVMAMNVPYPPIYGSIVIE